MRSVILLSWLFPMLASADNLYRCVSEAGHVSYQSAVCPTDQRTDRTIEFVPGPVSVQSTTVSTSNATRRASNSGSTPRQNSIRRRGPQPSPCAQAKAKRELELQRLGLKRTYEDLSRIDATTRAVCKGY